ncbi:MAG: cytochrome c-type biogenesis protein [Pseudomonadales bacterium]
MKREHTAVSWLLFQFLLLCLLATLLPLPAPAAIDAYPFPNDEMENRYNALIDELRCPQCLNTNLAGSDAMIAQDLRREVHRLILDGNSDEEILNFMYERYGDFILYKPKLKPGTLLLWFGPALFFMIALFVVLRVVLGRKADTAHLSAAEHERLSQLLKDK